MLIDVEGATDVSEVGALPRKGLPDGVRPVRKRTLIDLLDLRHGLTGESMPEKIEGLTWGPRRADGSRTLVVTTDNDFRDDVPGWVWVFSVPEAALGAPVGAAGAGSATAARAAVLTPTRRPCR